jgi:hypothetical protein
MKYTLSGPTKWNGQQPLPQEIYTHQPTALLSEFELLGILCGLHGHVSAMDVMTGAEQGTEKDADLDVILTTFQAYCLPRMPLMMYDKNDRRIRNTLVPNGNSL